MDIKQIRKTILVVAVIVCNSIVNHLTGQNAPKREMRGIWISTVSNIDWPSKPGMSARQLKQEANDILDHLEQMGFNAVFFQVRPASDAFYASSFEPWSSYLTGQQGIAPGKGFDPLQYWIEQAHQRGIELHAWVNPFRATTNASTGVSPQHITQTHPEWLIQYNKKAYIDPGIPEAREHIHRIIEEITLNYDIDGIHLDDYFYPYPVAKEIFGDTLSYKTNNPEALAVGDWRRQNINRFIEGAQKAVKRHKPWVAFGVSPFGVWRNASEDARGSQTKAGTTAYDILHADVLTWMQNKWIDYVIPQIYWETTHPSANFNTLAEWWAKQPGCTKYLGHALYKINNGTPSWNNKDEMPQQLAKARKTKEIEGSVLFSYSQFRRDLLGLDSFLVYNHYRTKALTPIMASQKIGTIKIDQIKEKNHILQWQSNNDQQVRFFIVYRWPKKETSTARDGRYIYSITNLSTIKLDHQAKGKYYYMVSPVDRFRREHQPSKRIKVKH